MPMAKTKSGLLAQIAAIISTLADTGGSPESMLYIFLDMDMNLWTKVRAILTDSNLIQVKGHYVTLTDSGKDMAAKINGAIRCCRSYP